MELINLEFFVEPSTENHVFQIIEECEIRWLCWGRTQILEQTCIVGVVGTMVTASKSTRINFFFSLLGEN